MKLLWSRALISAFFIFTAVAGCGGGPGEIPKDIEDATKTTDVAGTSACMPESASPGQKITCEVGQDFNEDCTVFFGQSLPLEAGETATLNTYVLDKEEGTITLIVPSVVFSSLDITSCCTGVCDERTPIAEDFPILPTSSSPPPLPPSLPPSTPDPPDGEEPPPAPECSTSTDCTGGKICTGGACVAPPPPDECDKDDDGDAVKNCEDACSGTPSGESVDVSGCSSSQLPPPPEFKINGFTAIHQPDTRLGHVKVQWNVQTGGRTLEELYIYSQGWNWLPGEDCRFKVENDQFKPRSILLLTDGAPLTFGTPKADEVEEMMSSSQKCDNDKCKGGGYTGPQSDQPPWCRLDLKQENGNFRTEGTVYTRVQASGLKYFLYARASDDSEAFKASSEIDIPDPTFDGAALLQAVTLSRDSVKLHELNIEYSGALSAPTISGCKATSSHSVDPSGEGTYSTDCDYSPSSSQVSLSDMSSWSSQSSRSGVSSSIVSQSSQANFVQSSSVIANGAVTVSATPQPWNKTFTVNVPGIGKTFSRTYKVECKIFAASLNELDPAGDYFPLSPGAHLTCDDSDPFADPCNKDGKVRLTGKASTQCKLYKKKSNGSWKTTAEKTFGNDYPWGIKELKFLSTNPLAALFGPDDFRKIINNPTQKSLDKKAIVGSTQLKRTFDAHEYLFAAVDYGGSEKTAVRKARGFTPAFEITSAGYKAGPFTGDPYGDYTESTDWNQDGCWFDSWDGCGGTIEYDCGECVDWGTQQMRVAFQWKGRYLKEVKSTNCGFSHLDQPAVSSPSSQTGEGDTVFSGGNSLNCDFEAIGMDGTNKIHWHGVTWGCGCAGDQMGEDEYVTRVNPASKGSKSP